MKTKNTIVIALACLLFQGLAFTSNAQSDTTYSESTVTSKLSVHEVQSMQFRVCYYKPQSQTIIVRIMDMDKNILFSENKRSESTYVRYFDLSTLSDGSYTFEITDGKEKSSKTFDILTRTSRVVSSIKTND